MARRKHGRRADGDVLLDGKRYRLVGDLEPAAYARAAERVAAIMARTPEYAEAPAERWKVFELTGSFFDVVKLPFGTRDRIASAYPSVEDWDALIQAAWDAALKHRALRRDGEGAVIFPLPLPMTSYAGHPAELVVAPSRYRDAGQTWYAPFCAYRKPRVAAAEPVFAFGAGAREALPVYATDEEVHRRARAEEAAMRAEASVAGVTGEAGIAPYAPARYVEKRALLDYAWLGNEAETLGKLARMAEPERWDDGSDGPLGVLRNYLFGVFSAAQRQGLVLERPQDDFAAFNTGLTTPFASPVYMCFRVNRSLGRQEWAFSFFAEPGVGRAGKRLLEAAGSALPAAPALPAVAYGGEAVHVDYRHLAMRLFRLPGSFARAALEGDDGAIDLLAQAFAATDPAERAQRFEALSAHVLEHRACAERLRRHLARAVEASAERWHADPDLAAANYNPERDTASVLLPLWLTGGDDPDAALIAAPVGEGCWQGHTVVTLRQAYRTARIAGSQGTPWLAQAAQAAAAREAQADQDRAWAEAWLARRAAERRAQEEADQAAAACAVREGRADGVAGTAMAEAGREERTACADGAEPLAQDPPARAAAAAPDEPVLVAGEAANTGRSSQGAGLFGRLRALLEAASAERRARGLPPARYHTA